MKSVFILLGANLDDPKKQIKRAISEIISRIGSLCNKSSLYISDAWGIADQPTFYNQVIKISTSLEPNQILQIAQDIEIELGRVRHEKWGARLIDIDILYYEDQIIDEQNLKVPHPYIQDRRFTLIPLVEIAADFIHPILHKTNRELLTVTADSLDVRITFDYCFFDPDILTSNIPDTPDILKTFVGLYLTQSPIDFDNLSKSITDQNFKNIADNAHHIRPTMQYIGAITIRQKLQHLEDLARSNQNIEVTQNYFNDLSSDFSTLLKELQHFHKSLS